MKAQELKNSILQLAIQGKLVEQRAEEGTAKELLMQIKAEKKQLMKEKRLKKEKPLPEITESEIPFEIPESWEWVRLQTLCVYLQRGRSPLYSEIKKIPVIAQKCNQWEEFQMEKAKFIEPDTLEKYAEERLLQDKDVLINSTGLGTVGRNQMYPADKNPYGIAVADSHVTVVRLNKKVMLSEFFFYYWRNPSVQSIMEDITSGSTKQKELALTTIQKYIVPLPPLAEQKRIVSKIEEIFSYVKQYDMAYTKIETFHKKFPEDMKKAMLQFAIQGKLVEQREEEGTAEELYQQILSEKKRLINEGKIRKEKPLPEIKDEEIPFEIPESWKWVKLIDICTKLVDGNHNPPAGVGEITQYIMASSTNINNDTLVELEKVRYLTQEVFEKENERTNVQEGDILFTSVGTLGRSCIYKGGYNICFQRSVSVIRTLINNFYLKYLFDSAYFQYKITREATGTAQKGFYLNKLASSLVPLPPLAEQKRIVAKLEQLLPCCEQLMK